MRDSILITEKLEKYDQKGRENNPNYRRLNTLKWGAYLGTENGIW